MPPIRQPLGDIQRRGSRIGLQRVRWVVGVVSLFPALAPRFARAEGFGPGHAGDDGWLPSLAQEVGARSWTVAAGALYTPGLVPPFRAGSRDRLAFGVGGRWMPDARVQLSAGFDGLWDRSAGATDVGAGDIRLGAAVWLVDPGPVRLWLGWSAKLPDAKDEGELGTDETDITFGGAAELHLGPWRVLAGAGLGVWGNPLRFANQDDVPELRATAAWSPSPALNAGVAFNSDLGTARNPARVLAGGWLRASLPLGPSDTSPRGFLEVAGGAGLTPAAADGIAALSFGVGGPPAAAAPPSLNPPR